MRLLLKVGQEEVDQAIAVEVLADHAHARLGVTVLVEREPCEDGPLLIGAVLLSDPEVIGLPVVRHEEVLVPVPVEVLDHDPETGASGCRPKTDLLADVHEGSVTVLQEEVGLGRGGLGAVRRSTSAVVADELRIEGQVAHDVQVEVPVPIVIEGSRRARPAVVLGTPQASVTSSKEPSPRPSQRASAPRAVRQSSIPSPSKSATAMPIP